ncbi:MAG: SPFH domain-containing protein [Terracidiphilus sp.]|jgi:regulator of protease activity HflC (stomatin/prohibitin superfamily)
MTGIIIGIIVFLIIIIILLILSVRTVRPTSRGLVERFGKYNRFANPGIVFLIPFIEHLVVVNITENMIDAGLQEIITSDSLNAKVDAQVYFKVRSDEASVKASQYSVFNYMRQIVALARTTLRNIIGTMSLKDANSERGKINNALYSNLAEETKSWGLEIVRTELKEISPPPDVQETMNKVVKASNERVAAIDFATARETQADGERRAAIKVAEGQRQAAILQAEGQQQAKVLVADGEAQAIKLVNESADLYFKGNAQQLRKLQAVETSLTTNSKIVVPTDSALVNVVGNLAGIDTNQPKK